MVCSLKKITLMLAEELHVQRDKSRRSLLNDDNLS